MFDQIHRFFGEIDQVTRAMRDAAEVQMKAYADLTEHHWRARDAIGDLRPRFRGDAADEYFQSQRHSLALGRLALQHLEQHASILKRWADELEGLRHEHLGLLLGIVSAVPGLDLVLEFLGNHFEMPSLDAVARMGPDALIHPLTLFDSLTFGGGGGTPGGLGIEDMFQRLSDRGLSKDIAREHVGRFGDQMHATAAAVQDKQASYKAEADSNQCQSPWVPDQKTFSSTAHADGTPEAYQPGAPKNMQQLYAMIDHQYQRKGGTTPIGITQVGDNTVLVTLAGVEPKFKQTNNLGDAITALGQENNPNDPYEKDVERALADYIKNHRPPFKQPVRVIIAGHSYGGAVGEEMAATDNNNGMWKITDVATFGSPEIGSEFPPAAAKNGPPVVQGTYVHYKQYFSAHDIVPLASGYALDQAERAQGLDPTTADPSFTEGLLVGTNLKGDLHQKALYTGGVREFGSDGQPIASSNPEEIGLNDNTRDFNNRLNVAHDDPHGAYLYSDQLKQTAIPDDWGVSGNHWGQTQYYFVSNQDEVANLYDPQVQYNLQHATPTPSNLIGPGAPTPSPKK